MTETSTIRVLLVDDHRVVRDGLKELIARESDMEVVGDCGDGRTAIKLATELTPDVVVMDVGMGDLGGVEATRTIKREHGDMGVVMLTMHSDRRYVMSSLEAGADGYVVKDAAGDELHRAIRAVHRGQRYMSSEVTGVAIDGCVSGERGIVAPSLGPREREVVQLIAEGKTSGEVAQALHISVSTVDTHRRNIMRKLGLHSVAELTKYAIREGLTSV